MEDAKAKILVVEDQVLIADNLCDTLNGFGYSALEPVSNFDDAIVSIQNERPDVVILDIHLDGEKTGIDVGLEINHKFKIPFIFLTSNADRMTLGKAKLVQPFAFLTKPFNHEELYAAVEMALYNFANAKKKVIDNDNLVIKDALFVKHNKCYHRLKFEDIAYIKSDNVYLDIHMTSKKIYTTRSTMNDYLPKLTRSFERVHRSYIINLDHLEEINHVYVKVDDTEIAIAKNYKENLLRKINLG